MDNDCKIKTKSTDGMETNKTNSKTNPDEVLKNSIKSGISLSELDTNGDGMYDFGEWKTELARMGISIPENFQLTPGLQNFKENPLPVSSFDVNGDGYLNQEDIKDYIKANPDMKRSDINGDGAFDYKYIVQGLKRYGINITPEQEEKIKKRSEEIFGSSGISI